ncbi:MAG: type 1 glutamine amidotransferase domain-containing protein [Aquisalimonadaceae bacterium]
MSEQLSGKRVAILATHGFEESELAEPRRALRDAGATVDIVSPESGSIKAWAGNDWGGSYPVDRPLTEAQESDYDALVVPGGVMNPDTLRINEAAIRFTRSFFKAEKPVASICHGPWVLINAEVVKGRRMTSWPSVSLDLRNAGALWVDEEVVVDNGLITSRKPGDLQAFNAKLMEEIREGEHAGQHA